MKVVEFNTRNKTHEEQFLKISHFSSLRQKTQTNKSLLNFGFLRTKTSESENLMNIKNARNHARNKSHVGIFLF